MIIKVLSFNIHKGAGWHQLRSTFDKLNEKIRELSPDLIFFQEILGAQAECMVLDPWLHYSYGRNAVYSNDHFGNAIFSKFPILSSENFNLSTHRFERRGLLHSVVEMPNGKRLHLLCVHLGLFKTSRQIQYERIVGHIKEKIDDAEPIILGGDFNDWGSHATTPLVEDLGLKEAFLSLHKAYARTFPAWGPLLKLDRIYSRGLDILTAERMTPFSWRILSDHLALNVNLRMVE